MLEYGPRHRISVWREDVAKKAGEAGLGPGGGGGDDSAAGGTDGEGCSDLNSHVGCRRVSAGSVESLSQGSATGSSGKSHRSRESAESTKVSVRFYLSLLQI